MKIVQKEATISIDSRVDMTIKQNEEKLRQVLLILLDNAIKYVDYKGLISVVIIPLEGHVMIKVTNSGAEISSEDLSRIFERFYRGTKAKKGNEGHGLGLAIAKEIVQLLGGQIFAESVVDEIATFGFVLPINEQSNHTK